MKATKPYYETLLVFNISKTMERFKYVCQLSSTQPNHEINSLASYNVLSQSRNSARFTELQGPLPFLIYNEYVKMTQKFITMFTTAIKLSLL
jgi:hypothetical protein